MPCQFTDKGKTKNKNYEQTLTLFVIKIGLWDFYYFNQNLLLQRSSLLRIQTNHSFLNL